ncbi:MAG: DMT family transporter [Chloroflexi bacterium]|nr:DMT family transporter [Chloroflexota bacterium]
MLGTRAGINRKVMLGYLFALLSGLSYGGGQVVGKHILQTASPLVTAAFGNLFGLIGMTAIASRDIPQDRKAPWKAHLLLLFAGLFSSAGVLLFLSSLSFSPIVVVSPVAGTQPLFAIFFAYIFLRSTERITWRVVAGAGLVVAGVAIISVSSLLT